MQYLSRILKFFLVTTILFGALIFTFMVVFGGSVKMGISFGVKFGLISSISLTAIGFYNDYIFRRWVFAKLKLRSFDLSQRREIDLKGDLKTVFSKTLSVLKMIPAIKEISPDQVARKISAKTGSSILTFGELIEVELFHETGNTKAVIYSKPRLKTTVADCGKNIENVEIISALLKDERKGKQLLQKVTMPSFLKAVIICFPFAIVVWAVVIINN